MAHKRHRDDGASYLMALPSGRRPPNHAPERAETGRCREPFRKRGLADKRRTGRDFGKTSIRWLSRPSRGNCRALRGWFAIIPGAIAQTRCCAVPACASSNCRRNQPSPASFQASLTGLRRRATPSSEWWATTEMIWLEAPALVGSHSRGISPSR